MKHLPIGDDGDGSAGAWVRYEAGVAPGALRLRVRAPSATCTATIAAIALDECDELLRAIDGWLQAELDWRWEQDGVPGELRERPVSTLALAEADCGDDGTSRSVLPSCRLEVPWTVLRRAGAPPPPLASRLRWHETAALLTLSTMDLDDAELSAIEPGGAVVLAESMRPQWTGLLHLPDEPPEQGMPVAVGASTHASRRPSGAAPPMPALPPPALPLADPQNLCRVRSALPIPLGAALFAGWQELDDAIGNVADRPVELWLEQTAAPGPIAPTRLASGRLIPWGNGLAMLVDECE